MGITGLLPFLEKASKRTNVSEFSGGTVAIDTYCWLHKGVFSCAEKVMMGQTTNALSSIFFYIDIFCLSDVLFSFIRPSFFFL